MGGREDELASVFDVEDIRDSEMCEVTRLLRRSLEPRGEPHQDWSPRDDHGWFEIVAVSVVQRTSITRDRDSPRERRLRRGRSDGLHAGDLIVRQ